MKKIKMFGALLLTVIIGSGICAFGLGNEVPQKVKDAFTIKFPGAKKVKWDMESEVEWEAEFRMKGMEYSANFLEDGTWQATEHKIKIKAVHVNIQKMLQTQFEDYNLEKVELLEKPDGLFYEFELEKDDSVIEILVDKDGKVVHKNPVKKN